VRETGGPDQTCADNRTGRASGDVRGARVGARGRAGPGGQLQRHRAVVFRVLPATLIIRARVLYISASKIKKLAYILIFFTKKGMKYRAIPLFVFLHPCVLHKNMHSSQDTNTVSFEVPGRSPACTPDPELYLTCPMLGLICTSLSPPPRDRCNAIQ